MGWATVVTPARDGRGSNRADGALGIDVGQSDRPVCEGCKWLTWWEAFVNGKAGRRSRGRPDPLGGHGCPHVYGRKRNGRGECGRDSGLLAGRKRSLGAVTVWGLARFDLRQPSRSQREAGWRWWGGIFLSPLQDGEQGLALEWQGRRGDGGADHGCAYSGASRWASSGVGGGTGVWRISRADASFYHIDPRCRLGVER